MLDQNVTINFKKLTRESIKSIEERIFNDKLLLEIENDECKPPNKKPKPHEQSIDADRKQGPNKDLLTGKKLPERFKNLFDPKLFSIPIEEIDEFYQNDYVLKNTEFIIIIRFIKFVTFN